MQMDTTVHVNKAWYLHTHDITFWTLFIIITVTCLTRGNCIVTSMHKVPQSVIHNFLLSDKFNWSHWRIYSPKWKFQTLNEPSPGWIGVLKDTLQNQPLHITHMNIRFLRKCKISPKKCHKGILNVVYSWENVYMISWNHCVQKINEIILFYSQ